MLWEGVVGQAQAVARLQAALLQPVHAYLFVGPPGSGKRRAARAFAAALLCHQAGDGTCRDCRLVLAGQHPDVREVERLGAAISKEQADDLIRMASLKPLEGSRKILILDELHLIQPEVPPRLLKTIEEPEPSAIFLLLADDVPPELVTIASRSVRIDFAPIPEHAVEAALVAEGVEEEAAQRAAAAAGGNLDRARVLALDRDLLARRDAFHRIPQRLDGSGAEVARAVDELLGLIDAAAESVKKRQAEEAAQLEARVEQLGERGAGRSQMTERHRRELRRHRTDELKAGLLALASAYRDELAEGAARSPAEAVSAIEAVQRVVEALDRNANETLMLQSLLLRLPPGARQRAPSR